MANKLFLYTLLLLVNLNLTSQNLVPNGSFEEYTDCPELLNQLPYAHGWWNARGTCDFMHSCGTPGVSGVPSNSFAHQDAVTGDGYAAFVTYSTTSSIEDYREHMITQFSEPLVIGETYFFSMYVSRGFQELFHNKASNGQGMMLSTTSFEADVSPSPPIGAAQYVNYDVLEDTSSWVQLAGSIVADQEYEYLLIGCFLEENEVDTANTFGLPEFGRAYYLVDEVRLSSDSTYVFENLVSSIPEFYERHLDIYPNPAQDRINIKSVYPIRRISILDSRGSLILTKSLEQRKLASFDMSKFPKGVYIVVTEFNDGSVYRSRIVKSE